VADFSHLKPETLNDYYKNHLSDFHSWLQKPHAEDFTLYRDNVGRHLSIDETSLSNGELYTIVTNKAGHGRKGTLVAMVKGVKADYVIQKLQRLPVRARHEVESVTMDMSNSMYNIVSKCFPNAEQVIDRFHVQKLMYDALQELRIQYRWQAMSEENRMRDLCKEKGIEFKTQILRNGDTMKQLLVRCRYLLVRKPDKWTDSQKARAEVLFEQLPDIKEFYYLALQLGYIYSTYNDKNVARPKLALWFNRVEIWHYPQFDTVIKTFMQHYERILNDIVCINGNHRYTRALYGTHTLFRLETSDRPVFATFDKSRSRNIRFILTMDGQDYALDSTSYCESRYQGGKREYILKDHRWGKGVLHVTAWASFFEEGALWEFSGQDFSSPFSLTVRICAVRNLKMKENGELGIEPRSSFEALTA
jgi:hypothetical protein